MSTQEKYITGLNKKLEKIEEYLHGKYRDYPIAIGEYLQKTDTDPLYKLQDDLKRLVDPNRPVEITKNMFKAYMDRATEVFAATYARNNVIKRALKNDPTLKPNEYKVSILRRQCLHNKSPIEMFDYNADAIIASDNQYKEQLEREKVRYKKSVGIQQYVNRIKGPLPPDYDNNNTKHRMWFTAATSIYQRLFARLEQIEDGKQIEDRYSVSMSYRDLWDLINQQEWKCAFTQLPFYEGKSELDQGTYSGLKSSPDRLDPLKGYHKGNVEFVLLRINLMKWTNSYSEYLSLCSDIATYAVTNYNITLLNVNEIINALDNPVDEKDITL